MRRVLLLACVLSCKPDFGDRESLVESTRILAVRAEPPEARPGEVVTYSLLVATPVGPVEPVASFAHCAVPKLLTENGAVSPACLGDGVRPIGGGTNASAVVPPDACFLFGPEVSSADLRPRDPDVTGGYYQPVRVVVPDAEVPAFGFVRLRCRVASAGAEIAAEHDRRYVPNRNPTLLPLEGTAPLDAIPRGARVTLRASWPEGDAEAYVSVDVAEARVVDRREAMRVSWFVTGGALASDRTGRAEEELETFTENDWVAPGEAGPVHLHLVLRDSRGGVAFTSYVLHVR